MRRPIPSHPREVVNRDEWDRWYNIISRTSSHLFDFDVTIDPSLIAANTTAEQSFTVTGLGSSDIPLAVIKPTATAGIGIVGFRVISANTLGITFINATGGGIDPPSETYKLVVIRQ